MNEPERPTTCPSCGSAQRLHRRDLFRGDVLGQGPCLNLWHPQNAGVLAEFARFLKGIGIVVLVLVLVSCVGALQGGTFRGSPSRYWGLIDVEVVTVEVVSIDGTPRPGVPVRASFTDGKHARTIDGVTDATGHAKLEIVWQWNRSAHDATGDYIVAHVSAGDHAAVDVIVRPAKTSPLSFTLPKGHLE